MKIFSIIKQDRHILINILGLKLKFRNYHIDYLGEMCLIPNLEYLKNQNTTFPHPIGIVIHKNIKIGKNCYIFQNVTIGDGKYNEERQTSSPIIGNNVMIYANAVLIGGITVGDNAIIGAGAVVLNDVPANCTVAGNPAKIIKTNLN